MLSMYCSTLVYHKEINLFCKAPRRLITEGRLAHGREPVLLNLNSDRQ